MFILSYILDTKINYVYPFIDLFLYYYNEDKHTLLNKTINT